ncbi:MAG TPA: hypothetical protein VMV27_16380 [Candidatus Binataceae bacterium]|nr:hypothetical protein [Candidatus Binataceae bacterium]
MSASGEGAGESGALAGAVPDELRIGLAQIEHNLNEGRYRPGPWERYIRELKRQPGAARAALARDVSRVSRKLHQRTPRKTISVRAAVAIELGATALGAIVLVLSRGESSAALGLAGALVWIMSLQPIVKISAAAVLGVGYEYAYLLRGEPRFKMRFGDYVAAPRWARVILHLCGTIGSPLGAWAAARMIRAALPGTAELIMAAFWILIAINAVGFVAGLAGIGRMGSIRTAEGSGGAAGLEIREALA